MCGVIGVSGYQPVNSLIYEALTVLQHRGQDAAGIATCINQRFFLKKANGLVRDVFQSKHMLRLQGNMGIGHVRYPTAGTLNVLESQPFYVNSPFGIMLVHNGNLTNDHDLRKEMFLSDKRHLNTGSDSEVLLNVLAHELYKQSMTPYMSVDSIFDAVTKLHQRCHGGYSAIALINGHGLLAFKDPHGIRPLVLGQRQTKQGVEYMVASESVALDCSGFDLIREVKPGEAIFISEQNKLYSKQCTLNTELTPCLFEYVYLARPDSIIEKVSVYKARLNMGKTLAQKIKTKWTVSDIDVVMPIPDSSRAAALELAENLNVPYREGLVKNRYINRTFIMPGQEIRKISVRRKLNAISEEFKDKNVLLVDDSIVRGTTCKQIIELAREAGAKKVYFCSAAPPIRYPNVYGIDMPTSNELIAYNRTEDQVQQFINADGLMYQDLNELINIISKLNPQIQNVEGSVFNGHYVTGDIDEKYFKHLSEKRNNSNLHQDSSMDDII